MLILSKLRDNLRVNKGGVVFIPYDILKSYIDPTLTKIPFDFNDAENQIELNPGIDQKYIDKYEKNFARQNRKFLHFEVITRKIKKPEKQVKNIIASLSEKLASLEDTYELKEILQNIEDAYTLEQYFCFYFTKSNMLKKFVNLNFDIELIESIDGSLPKRIVFKFKSIDNITPRTLNAKIHQGTLLIHKKGPPKTVKHFMEKDYVIIKLFSLMENHSANFKDLYDILITCNEEIVNQIFQSKDFINPNVFSGVYTNKSQNFYISKLKFKKFLKSLGKKFLYINNVLTNEVYEVPFDEETYDQFLSKFDYYDEDYLKILKEKANKGISKYYSHFKDFLDIKDNNISYDSNLYTQLKENLENLNFSNITKREIFNVNVKVHFMDNLDIIITRDKDLKIDYSSKPILEGLENNVEKGRDLFLKEYNRLIKNREVFKIDDNFYKNMYYTLKSLKYNSALNFTPEFVKDCFYYFGILKNNVDLINSYFVIRNNTILDTIAIVLGIQNSFRKYFPKENATAYFNLFFTSKFANFPEINSITMFKIKKYCQDMIFIFEATQDLKLLQRELKDKFRTNIEFKSVVKSVEESIDKKIKMQEDFGQILEVIKKEVRVKKSSPKNVNEIKEILEQKLKGEFSEDQYIESVKSIETLLKSKMKPMIGYDVILTHLDSCFKKKITSNKQVDEIIEYINSNLKAEFEDKKKFDSIVKGIRKTYDSKFEDRKKYSNILNQLERRFKSLKTEEDIHKIQLYIDQNLEKVFESSQERQSIFRQIDREFLNKAENPKELEDIIKLSAELVKIFINDTGWHSIIVASIFTAFILALNKDKEITIKSICKILDVLSPSVSLHIKKLLSNYLENERTAKFDNLKITDEGTRQDLRLLLVKQLLESNIYMIFNVEDSKRFNNLIERFRLRIDFFTRHEQFIDSIKKVSKLLINKYIKEFIHKIKNIENEKKKGILVNDLEKHLNFFKNYELFNGALISLKEDIEGLEFLTPESKKIVLHKFKS